MNVPPIVADTRGFWPFQQTWEDISGNAFNLVQVTGTTPPPFVPIDAAQVEPTFWASAQSWSATSELNTPASALLRIPGNVTISWLMVQDDPTGFSQAPFYSWDAGNLAYGLRITNGILKWLQNGLVETNFSAGITNPLGEIHYCMLVRTGNNVTYWQDGVAKETVAVGPVTLPGTTPQVFCGNFHGRFCCLRIVARAFTQDEIVEETAFVFSDAPSPPAPGPSEHGNAVGSLETGTIGADTGSDSVDTATGVCPPAPELLLKDGASIETGTESIDTATNPVACGSGIVAEPPEGFLWFKADTNDPTLMTVDGFNRCSRWINQFPPPLDVLGQNSFGVPTAPANWPVWNGGGKNGYGYLHFGGALSAQALMKIYAPGTLNQPTADGEPLLILSVCETEANPITDNVQGAVLVMRLNNNDFECCLYTSGIFLWGLTQIPISSAQDAHARFIGYGSGPFPNGASFVNDYRGAPMLMDWQYRGVGTNPNNTVRINGRQPPCTDFSPTALLPYGGVSGFTVGNCNATFGEYWKGKIYEILGYRGDDALDPDVYLQAYQYLNDKYALNLFPPT